MFALLSSFLRHYVVMIFMVPIGGISHNQGAQCRRCGYIPPIREKYTNWSSSLYCFSATFKKFALCPQIILQYLILNRLTSQEPGVIDVAIILFLLLHGS